MFLSVLPEITLSLKCIPAIATHKRTFNGMYIRVLQLTYTEKKVSSPSKHAYGRKPFFTWDICFFRTPMPAKLAWHIQHCTRAERSCSLLIWWSRPRTDEKSWNTNFEMNFLDVAVQVDNSSESPKTERRLSNPVFACTTRMCSFRARFSVKSASQSENEQK